MLILYFYIFQRDFEVFNEIFQASAYVTIVTATVRKFFDISLVVQLLIYSKKSFLIYKNKNCSCICKSIIITSSTEFNIALTNVEARLKQHCINVVPTLCNRFDVEQWCFDFFSTSGTAVVSTLRNVENPTSDFVLFSTSDPCYFNVDPQC